MAFDRSWRLSGKEKRYQRDVNHEVSKRIVAFAARYPQAVVVDSAPGSGTTLGGWVLLLEAAE